MRNSFGSSQKTRGCRTLSILKLGAWNLLSDLAILHESKNDLISSAVYCRPSESEAGLDRISGPSCAKFGSQFQSSRASDIRHYDCESYQLSRFGDAGRPMAWPRQLPREQSGKALRWIQKILFHRVRTQFPMPKFAIRIRRARKILCLNTSASEISHLRMNNSNP
jgi:transposase-like protein